MTKFPDIFEQRKCSCLNCLKSVQSCVHWNHKFSFMAQPFLDMYNMRIQVIKQTFISLNNYIPLCKRSFVYFSIKIISWSEIFLTKCLRLFISKYVDTRHSRSWVSISTRPKNGSSFLQLKAILTFFIFSCLKKNYDPSPPPSPNLRTNKSHTHIYMWITVGFSFGSRNIRGSRKTPIMTHAWRHTPLIFRLNRHRFGIQLNTNQKFQFFLHFPILF